MTEITSRTNRTVVDICALKSGGNEEGYILEGDKFIFDTPRRNFVKVFTSNSEKYSDFLSSLSCEIYSVSEPVMEKLTSEKSGTELLAVVKKSLPPMPGKLLILDGIQDPGNVGTAIRTAYCFGYGVICGKRCASPFSPKTVRSAAGALTGCYVKSVDLTEFLPSLKDYEIYGACLDEEAFSLRELKPAEKCAVVIGSEGKGISPEVLALCGKKVYIPIKNVESLNASVAAAICVYALSE